MTSIKISLGIFDRFFDNQKGIVWLQDGLSVKGRMAGSIFIIWFS